MKSITAQVRAWITRKPSHALLHITLALSVLLTAESVRALDSTWTGVVGTDWNNAGNWAGGVPNNGVDTFNAFVGPINSFSEVTVGSPVVIDNLQIGGNGETYLQVENTTFSVLQTSSSIAGFVTISSSATTAATTVDLGTLANFSSATLSGVMIAAESFGFQATVQWATANIQTIGSHAGVSLHGAGSFIRNSSDNADALAGLSSNEGSFSLSDRDFTTSGNFSNAGELSVSAFGSDSTLSINGNLAQNTPLVLDDGQLNVSSGGGFSGVIEWAGANIQTIGSGAGVSLHGAGSLIRNSSGNTDALADLESNEGFFAVSDRDFTTTGNFSNAGYLGVSAFSSDSTLSINGNLAQNTPLVLDAGQLSVAGRYGFSGVMEWDGANIQTIGSSAGVSLYGAGSFIRNSSGNTDALAGLESNEGSFSLFDRNFTTAGNFSNSGHLQVSNGTLAAAAGGDFSNSGYLQVSNGTVATAAGGDFSLSSTSTLVLEISDESDFGAIEATGLITLDGEIVVILNLRNGVPAVENSDVFTVISGTGITGMFYNITSGERIFDQSGGYSFLYTATSNNVTLSDFAAIPEPSTYTLLALGALTILTAMRRRRANA